MAPRVNANIAISRLLKEALTIAKWAEQSGTDVQKLTVRKYIEVTIKVAGQLSPNFVGYTIPIWQLPSDDYLPLAQGKPTSPAAPKPSPSDAYYMGNQAAFDKQPRDSNPFPADTDPECNDHWYAGYDEVIPPAA